MIKNMLAGIGALVLFLYILGSFNIGDFVLYYSDKPYQNGCDK